eukprot:g5134.t1
MDIDAFLAAQLWLRRLPDESWPPDDRNAQQGSGGVVILAQARCCFLLEDRPSSAPQPPRASRSTSDNTNTSGGGPGPRHASGGARSDGSPGPRQRPRPRPLWFSLTRSTAAAASAVETNGSTCGARGGPGPTDGRPPKASSNGMSDRHGAEKGPASLLGGHTSLFKLDSSGTVRPRGREGHPARARSTAAAAPAAVKSADAVPLEREYDFGLAVSRPGREGCKGGGDDDGRSRPPGGGGSGTLLLRIGGKVFQAEHTLIRSIAYPRGGGGGGGGSGSYGSGGGTGGSRDAAKGRSDEGPDLTRGNGLGADGRGKSPPPPPPPPSPPVPGTGLPPLRSPSTATIGAGSTGRKRALEASAAGGAGGIAGVGRGGHGCRSEGGGKRGRLEAGDSVVVGTTRRGHGRAVDAAAVAAAAAAPTVRRSHNGEGEDRPKEGIPYCGLFFPGVLLRFWQEGNLAGTTRAEAVARMQGVVSNMMAELSPNPRYGCPPSGGGGGGIARSWLDGEIQSVVAEGKENGFLPRCKAWDEFVYGSHVLLRQERAYGLRQESGDGAAGPSELRGCARCSVGFDAPVLSGYEAWRWEDGGGPSDVGRARALTCLAECFCEASLPSSVKLSAQRLLQGVATSAGRELEGALERAFPLDLSQGTDTSTRASVVSELEASLQRVQAARRAALTLSLMPTSEMLDESGDRA